MVTHHKLSGDENKSDKKFVLRLSWDNRLSDELVSVLLTQHCQVFPDKNNQLYNIILHTFVGTVKYKRVPVTLKGEQLAILKNSWKKKSDYLGSIGL